MKKNVSAESGKGLERVPEDAGQQTGSGRLHKQHGMAWHGEVCKGVREVGIGV